MCGCSIKTWPFSSLPCDDICINWHSGIYSCPCYYYSNRAGTTSHRSHIVNVDLKSGSHSSEHWIKRGTALLMSLDYWVAQEHSVRSRPNEVHAIFFLCHMHTYTCMYTYSAFHVPSNRSCHFIAVFVQVFEIWWARVLCNCFFSLAFSISTIVVCICVGHHHDCFKFILSHSWCTALIINFNIWHTYVLHVALIPA